MENFVEQRYLSRFQDKFSVKYNLRNLNHLICLFRSSHLEVFCQKAVFRNFAKFSGKGLWWRLVYNKVAAVLHPATLFKKRLQNKRFCEFYSIFKNSCSYRTSPVAASVYFLLDGFYFSLQPTIHVIN